ncbi:hypothetical protein RchiOBHm_Chr0c39g0503121 [Rosa chinensis]|uniref:Uncharacterized protein n=1 Tax=Rosa chinensis TaxID=74649 RepID=A0A2P6SQ21_ROSCH|nr:hypothetical protein RchiOBHm_Chr0c39g0503121 [Rosa chinensis]
MANRLDCGICVMYYMKKISKEEGIQKTISKKYILQYRAHIIKTFAKHRQS